MQRQHRKAVSQALVREESREDEPGSSVCAPAGSPETYYLMELMASHDFQTALQNYLDLEDLRSNSVEWKPASMRSTTSSDYAKNYDPLLPGVDAQFRTGFPNAPALEQRKQLASRLQAMLTAPRPIPGYRRATRARAHRSRRETDWRFRKSLNRWRFGNAHPLRGAITWRLEASTTIG
jgi:hypothetical protein